VVFPVKRARRLAGRRNFAFLVLCVPRKQFRRDTICSGCCVTASGCEPVNPPLGYTGQLGQHCISRLLAINKYVKMLFFVVSGSGMQCLNGSLVTNVDTCCMKVRSLNLQMKLFKSMMENAQNAAKSCRCCP